MNDENGRQSAHQLTGLLQNGKNMCLLSAQFLRSSLIICSLFSLFRLFVQFSCNVCREGFVRNENGIGVRKTSFGEFGSFILKL